MRNDEYWISRAEQRMEAIQNNADLVATDISQAYIKSTNYINNEMEKILKKVALNGGLTLAEAKSLLNNTKGKSIIDDLKLMLGSVKDLEIRKKLLSEINAPSYRSALERLQVLQENIDKQTKTLAEFEQNVTKNHYIDTIKYAYNTAIFEIQKGIGYGFSFNSMPTSRIEEILKNNWSGKLFSERIWGNADNLNQQIKEELLTGFMTGRGYKKTAKAINERMAVGSSNARRLVRTESTYMANMAELDSYAECEIDKYKYVATLDMHTSEVCRRLDGRIFKVSEGRSGVNLPSMHPYCRSTTIAYFDDYTIDATRFAKDGEGNRIKVSANMDYTEWYNKYVKDNPKAIMAGRKLNNKLADQKQYEKYLDVLGKENMPKGINNFQDLKYTNSKEWGAIKSQFKGMGYYNKALSIEPQITGVIKEVATKIGVDVQGLEFRIKSKESYLRKIKTNYKPSGNEYEINDILRYTYVSKSDILVDKTLKCIDNFAKEDYNTVVVKNSWIDATNPYKGINTIIQAPGGQKFEMQYHTPESFTLKNGKLHELYEKQRLIQDDESPEFIQLRNEMFALSDSLKTPLDIERVKNKK